MSTVTTAKSILTEYGLPWVVCRALYSAKLKILNILPAAESMFERSVEITHTDIIKVDTAAISAFLDTMSDTNKHLIIESADNAINGRIKAFSSLDLDYGSPINWQLNPLTGKSCSKNTRWYKIPDFDTERGDIKLIWEASRFTHFYLFARAYMLVRDKKYYEAFSAQLDDWLRNNPYPNGANFKCGQECALRMINVLTVYSVFQNYGLTNDHDAENVKELTKRCYQKILSNFFYTHRCIRNNHTLSELCGMIIGAWCCGDTPALNKAYRLLDKEIYTQFSSDGGYKQFSFNYQRFALQICSRVISLSGVTRKTLNSDSLDRIRKSALMMYQCQSEDGDLPNYGSNDGALIFPVTCCSYRNFKSTICAAYNLSGGERLYEAGPWDEETLWLGGVLTSRTMVQRKSSSFAEAGIYLLRSNDSMAMTVLNRFCSRPAHMDQLHFDLWHKGINIFCDCGTHSYASPLGNELALTQSHNTVKVDATEQMSKIGKFLICGWSKASEINYTDTEFEGKMTSQNGYSHKRKITLASDGYTLTDTVRGKNNFSVVFHTPLSIQTQNSELLLFDGNKPICTMKCLNCDVSITCARRSVYYLTYDEISVITLTPKRDTYQSICTQIKLF